MIKHDNAVVVAQVAVPGDVVTEYPVIADPPFETGTDQETEEVVFRFELAFTPAGAPGTVDGVAAAEATDAAEMPLGFVAVTVNV